MLTLLHNTNPGNLSNKILTCKKKASFELWLSVNAFFPKDPVN